MQHDRPKQALRREADQVLRIIKQNGIDSQESYLWGLRDGLKFAGMSNEEIEKRIGRQIQVATPYVEPGQEIHVI